MYLQTKEFGLFNFKWEKLKNFNSDCQNQMVDEEICDKNSESIAVLLLISMME
jgi:hypothetical protein